MQNLSKYNNFIFDFDGVICDSNHIKGESFVELFSKSNIKIMDYVYNFHLSNLSMPRNEKIAILAKTIYKKKISNDDINLLIKKFSNNVRYKISKINLNKGFFNLVKKIRSKNKKIILSTASPKNEIDRILKEKKIYEFFDYIYGSPDSKHIHFKKIFFNSNFSNKNTIFIGDTFKDYEVANKFSVDFYLYLNNQNIKIQRNFNFLINDFNLINC